MKRKTILADCGRCDNETNHNVLLNRKLAEDTLDNNDKVIMTIFYEYNFLECLGCEFPSLLLKTRVVNKKNKKTYTNFEVFPNYTSRSDEGIFLKDEEILKLPPLVRSLYNEIEEIFECNSSIISGLGLRTLLEAICVQEKIAGGNLKQKIDNMHKNGFVPTKSLHVLHNLREFGNITAHQIKKPTQKTLDNYLKIINHTLINIYILPRLNTKTKARN